MSKNICKRYKSTNYKGKDGQIRLYYKLRTFVHENKTHNEEVEIQAMSGEDI
jgi:hypothetical protein